MRNKKEILIVVLAILTLTSVMMTPAFSVDTLVPNDFSQKSFYKIIDFFDYARSNAAANGKTPPNASAHAWLYSTYVNTKGIQMMYAGLQNITTDGANSFTLPIQSWMMHYKSQNGSKDLVTAGSFIMLLAFNDTATSIYPDSPDKNDTLYASLNLGIDVTPTFGNVTPSGFSTRTTIFPLTSENDDTEWNWGMRYTNMTAIWWRTTMSTTQTSPIPIAISRYDELTFTYNLTLNPKAGTVTLRANYIIGKITDLWTLDLFHYNYTGKYGWWGFHQFSSMNVHQYLQSIGIRMSIVQFQSTVVLGHTTMSESDNTNVAANEKLVSNSSIITTTNDNEKIFNADFATKQTYKLYNHTDTTEKEYDTTTRTTKAANLANNPIFVAYTFLMRYIPIVLANMDPTLYQQAKEHLLSLTYADYFYIIAYPTYSGYRIEHDPTYTAYYNATALETANPPNWAGLILLATIVAIITIVAVVVIRSRRTKRSETQQTTEPKFSQPPPPTF